MAVITTPQKVGDYWPRYRKRAFLSIIAAQLVIALVIGGALFTTGVVSSVTVLIVTLIAVFAATVSLNFILVIHLLNPLGDMAAALTHVSGEQTIVTPPNPNSREFEKDGFKPLLQLIYTLSANREKTSESEAAGHAVDVASALSALPVGFIILDSNRKVIYANKNAPVRTDQNGNDVIDLLFDKNDDLDKWLDECNERAVQAERIWPRIANKIPGEEGRKIYDISASYQKGKQSEVVLTLLNRSDEYQPEDDNLDFIAFAAHELRGPITVIRGYLDVLNDELVSTLNAEQIELMSRLVVSANRLSSYINNILNASRYDRRHLKLRLKEESLANIYRFISDDMQLRASSQHRLLSVDLPTTLPTVAADTTGIGEVLGNLIDNAIKYSNEGGTINVTASATSDFVTVSVEDHGIGMPDQVIGNLFHKFYRSHRSRETVAGTGIGLYICKTIIESHGGTVGVKSTEGVGSTFTFSLPVYASVAEKLRADDNSNKSFIEQQGEGWIKNHSMYRG
jgi:two-component system phosphate regulon sensor histidine kinase PhoR/two-component system sensor histidine kinase VicK